MSGVSADKIERLFRPQRLSALLRRKRAIELSIDDEQRRPAPCGFALQRLKRNRLWLKD